MKNLEITTKINSQNKKEEKSIRILNQTLFLLLVTHSLRQRQCASNNH
jgi:hypothetical protein